MKSVILLLFAAVMLQAASGNLLEGPLAIGNPKTTVLKDGVYTITNPDAGISSILQQTVDLNQKKAGPVTFAAEAMAEDLEGDHGCYFGAIINLNYTDGTSTPGVNFGMGKDTFPWRRLSRIYTPKKPVKSVTYILQLYRVKGKVHFRNPQLFDGAVEIGPLAAPAKPSAKSKLGKLVLKPADRNLTTYLVKDGRPAAAIVGDAGLARKINAVIRAKCGVELPILAHTAYENAEKLDRNLIVIGSRDNNRTMSNLYNRHFALIDGKYPGPGGYDLHSLHNPFGDRHNVILAGGSDPAGDAAAVEKLIRLLEKQPERKRLALGFISDAVLSRSYHVAKAIKDIPIWEESVGYGGKGYFGWNCLAKCLAMLYITNDPYYKNEFMRLAFPKDKATRDELFALDDEAYHDRTDPIVKVYHYRGQFMTLYWDMVDENPLFSDEERLKIANKLYEQLVYRMTRDDYTNPYRNYDTADKLVRPDRHYCWEALLVWTAARYLDKDYPCFDTKEGLRFGRNAMEPLFKYPLNGNIAMYWMNTSIELQIYYGVLQGHRLVGSPAAKNYARNQTALSSLYPGSDDRTSLYTSIWTLLAGAYLAQDQALIQILQNKSKGGDYASDVYFRLDDFRIGQSFWPAAPYANDSIRANLGKWNEYWNHVPGDPEKQELLFTSFRTRPGNTGDFFVVDPHYSFGLRDPQHIFCMFMADLDGAQLLRGYRNELVPFANGLAADKQPFDAEIVSCGHAGNYTWITGRVKELNGFDWERTWFSGEGKFLIALDKLTARQNMQSARFDHTLNSGMNGKVEALANGEFQITVPKGAKHFHQLWSFSEDAQVVPDKPGWSVYLAGDGLTWSIRNGAMKTGDSVVFATLLRPGEPAKTRSCAGGTGRFAFAIPEHALLTLDPKGWSFATAKETFVLADGKGAVTGGNEAAVTTAGKLLAARPQQPFKAPPTAKMAAKREWEIQLEHAPVKLTEYNHGYAVASGKTVTLLELDGRVRRTLELKGNVMSLAAQGKTLFVGCRDEQLTAFDAQGKALWHFTSEMSDEVKKLGPYHHKSAVPGVRSLFVRDGKVYAGSAGTLEVIDAANGRLFQRLYPRFSAVEDILPVPGSTDIMLHQPCGGAGISGVTKDLTIIPYGMNSGVKDYLDGYGFCQVGKLKFMYFRDRRGQLGIADVLTGAQNRFVIRNAAGKALYEANFGSAPVLAAAMTESAGPTAEFTVFHRCGTVYIFNDRMELLKTLSLDAMVTCAAGSADTVYAGLEDGRILAFGKDHRAVEIGRLKGAVRLLQAFRHQLIAGSDKGELASFRR